MQIRRRLVIYVQGYDPRGLPEYYRMFRRNYRRSCELYGLSGNVTPAVNDPDRFITDWSIATQGDDWRVDTAYKFLRWQDIIRRDFGRPTWWKVLHMYRTYGASLLSGVTPRIMRAHWRFGLFVLYPMVLMTIFILVAALFGLLCAKLINLAGVPTAVGDLAGAAAGLASFVGLLWATESQTYLLYLCDDGISTYQFAHRRRPDWEDRMEIFAGYVVDAIRRSDADEAIIVGHSSGSFLAVDVLGRALARDPDLGRRGPRVRLLTIGANLPIVGFHRRAAWFRERIKRLASAPDIDWVDYQSRHDIMNFWPFDPVTGHGLQPAPGRRNPVVVPISFRDLWPPENFERRRWRFFQAHFQFLCANERLGAAYDFYLICCGPVDLMARAARPAQAALGARQCPQKAPSPPH
ncbi:MAG TPA: hypothetical protein VFL51_07005 [Pseudolabrys sp.]|nr:hypothetical protein [Pseudolabrys sp.]